MDQLLYVLCSVYASCFLSRQTSPCLVGEHRGSGAAAEHFEPTFRAWTAVACSPWFGVLELPFIFLRFPGRKGEAVLLIVVLLFVIC